MSYSCERCDKNTNCRYICNECRELYTNEYITALKEENKEKLLFFHNMFLSKYCEYCDFNKVYDEVKEYNNASVYYFFGSVYFFPMDVIISEDRNEDIFTSFEYLFRSAKLGNKMAHETLANIDEWYDIDTITKSYEIRNYVEKQVNLRDRCNELEEDNKVLRDKIIELECRPNGKVYEEAKINFEKLSKQ